MSVNSKNSSPLDQIRNSGHPYKGYTEQQLLSCSKNRRSGGDFKSGKRQKRTTKNGKPSTDTKNWQRLSDADTMP